MAIGALAELQRVAQVPFLRVACTMASTVAVGRLFLCVSVTIAVQLELALEPHASQNFL